MITKILTYIKSLYFNVRFLPLNQALKFPILIHPRFKIMEMGRGRIALEFPIKKKCIFLGFGGSPALQELKGALYIEKGAKLTFNGPACISEGTVLRIDGGGEIIIGKNFYCNKNNYFRSTYLIKIGDNCFFGWNNSFNTHDGHKVTIGDGSPSIGEGNIIIGDHTWITTYCVFLKNSGVSNDTIVATNSVVCKQYTDTNVLIGGHPASVIKKDVKWEA